MGDVREQPQDDVVLRPGIALPTIGYLASLACVIAMVVLVVNPSAANHNLLNRWFGGQVFSLAAWAFYKLGSQRIVLSADVMHVVGFVQVWNVRRGGIQETDLEDPLYALVIALVDGSVIAPFMFMIKGRAGLTRNTLSRSTISERMIEWNADALPDIAGDTRPLARRQIRLNLPLLLGLSVLNAAGAITLTMANIW